MNNMRETGGMRNHITENEEPFHSKYIEVNGSKIHYLESGNGYPMLFLHGNPTSSYLWRNVIPFLKPHAYCIAPDLPGMGYSDKTDTDYSFQSHYKYVEGFIEKLGLKNLTLVVHDWGSALGFYYALNHPENVTSLVFMESIVRPWEYAEMKWFHRAGFKLLRLPVIGELLIYGFNVFLNFILPVLTKKRLSKEIKNAYKRPFQKLNSRKPMLKWPREIPINGKPEFVYSIVTRYSQFLMQSDIPKLMLYATPGAVIDEKTRIWCEYNFKNMTSVSIGKGYHFVQEDQPDTIGKHIAKWYQEKIL